MPTPSERSIKHKRKRSGVLLPMIEDLLMEPVNIENQADINFINMLLGKILAREKERSNGRAVFSPSALASCLRQVYFQRHHQDLGIAKLKTNRKEPHFYFLTGNFLHLKWQFALWKLQEKINDPDVFKLIDVEHRIEGKHGDHGGTVDALTAVYREPLIVDAKGLNARDFGNIARGGASGYEIQLADYMMLYNTRRQKLEFGKISRALLLTENKGGPDNQHPIAMHETVIELDEYLPNVRHRLGVLREHEAEEKIPEPECTSIYTFQFQGCPFRGFCKAEVKQIQAERKRAEGGDSEYRIARPPTRKRKGR